MRGRRENPRKHPPQQGLSIGHVRGLFEARRRRHPELRSKAFQGTRPDAPHHEEILHPPEGPGARSFLDDARRQGGPHPGEQGQVDGGRRVEVHRSAGQEPQGLFARRRARVRHRSGDVPRGVHGRGMAAGQREACEEGHDPADCPHHKAKEGAEAAAEPAEGTEAAE